MSAPPLPPGHALRAASVWFRFHLGRHLRRRSFWLWALAVFAFLALIKGVARAPAHIAAQLLIVQLGPLITLFFCTGVIRQEIEDQTLTYGFSRPVGRGWLYMARVLATAAPVALLVLPGAVLLGLGTGPRTTLTYATGAVLAIAAYGGLFALVGQLIRWPTWFGLALLMFWEAGVGLVPGFLGRMTLAAHVRSVADLNIDYGAVAGDSALAQFLQPPAASTSLLVLVIFAACTLWLGGVLVSRREHRVTK